MTLPLITIGYPEWLDEIVEWNRPYEGDDERMRLAVALARENVLREGGGPFGAAIFDRESGHPYAVGVNMVMRCNSSLLHAEMAAFMMAHARAGSRTLATPGGRELVTSCEPCAMCLGATLWTGITRVVAGATREDAMSIGFDEGPVFEESYRYLRERGVEMVRGVLRGEARAVFGLYAQRGGEIY